MAWCDEECENLISMWCPVECGWFCMETVCGESPGGGSFCISRACPPRNTLHRRLTRPQATSGNHFSLKKRVPGESRPGAPDPSNLRSHEIRKQLNSCPCDRQASPHWPTTSPNPSPHGLPYPVAARLHSRSEISPKLPAPWARAIAPAATAPRFLHKTRL